MYVHKKFINVVILQFHKKNESAFHIHNTDYTGVKLVKSGATA